MHNENNCRTWNVRRCTREGTEPLKDHTKRQKSTRSIRVCLAFGMNLDGTCSAATLMLFLDRQEQLELWGQLLFRVQPVAEINSSNSAIGMQLDTQRFNIVGAVGAAGEVRQVELNLIPALVQTHRHGTNERLHSRCGLIVGRSKPSSHVLVVQHLHFEREILFQIFDNHHQEWKLDSKRFLGICWT